MTVLWCDFETRSRCDLPARGVYNYAMDASTDVLCLSYAFDDEEVRTWLPGQPFPPAVANFAGRIKAHNAAFERLIFWYVLQIDFKLEQFYCTATQARANCAPGGLEDVGRFAGASMKKDHRGSQLIRLLSIPQADGTFREDAALMGEMVRYCEQDVRAMRAISSAQRELSADELRDYHVNERINDRGILLDKPLALAAVRYAAAEAGEIQDRVREVTEGQITSVRSPKMREWVLSRVGPQALTLATVYKDGVPKLSIDKNVRANLLVLAESDPDEVPVEVAEVIQCADDLWASSVAKFNRAASLADAEDRRVRGAFVFAGGSATGRASSYGLQVHNFPRKCAADPALTRDAMVRGQEIVPHYGRRVTDVLKGMLRPALMAAPGKHLVVADWAAIEARVTPWASNTNSGAGKLAIFERGEDVYKHNAAATFKVAYDEVDKDQRQIGKVQELACLGPDTRVLTNNGVKAITKVDANDLLWDGEEWVAHDGLIDRGERETVWLAGLELTPDHEVLVGQTWQQAQTVVSCQNTLDHALVTGMVSLPWSAWNSDLWAAYGRLEWRVRVARPLTLYLRQTSEKARAPDATDALKKPLDGGPKTGSAMQIYAQMTRTGDGCATAYQPASTDATTRTIEPTTTTADAVSTSTNRGEPTEQRISRILSRLTDGIDLNSNLTELMSTGVTSRVISVSSDGEPTVTTCDAFVTCSSASTNLRRVYDIANAGPRNRFTVITDEGALIVHNCGFAGGIGAFAAMGRIYNVVLNESDSRRMVDGWRRANPWAPAYWGALERAYMAAMRNPGTEFSAGRVAYLYDRQHLWYVLPSGRVLCYPFARFNEEGNVTYAKAAWKPAADAKEWPRARLWRGLACENITQAVANDLLRHSLLRLEEEGFAVVLHVHDEIVLETADPEYAAAALLKIMTTPPGWAYGLPLNAEVATMVRYGK